MLCVMEIQINEKTVLLDEEVFIVLQFLGASIYVSSEQGGYPIVVFGYTNDKRVEQRLHRWVLGVPSCDIDHINRNRLDCRLANLRYATRQQNMFNRAKNRMGAGFTSVYKGVYFDKRIKKWRSVISINRKQVSLGSFKTEYEAALAYNKAASDMFGEFAFKNDVPEHVHEFLD